MYACVCVLSNIIIIITVIIIHDYCIYCWFSGVVGAAFNYRDRENYMLFEMSPSFARIRKRFQGVYSILSKTNLWGFKLGSWNEVKLSFNPSHIVVKAGNSTTALPVFSIGRSDGESLFNFSFV